MGAWFTESCQKLSTRQKLGGTVLPVFRLVPPVPPCSALFGLVPPLFRLVLPGYLNGCIQGYLKTAQNFVSRVWFDRHHAALLCHQPSSSLHKNWMPGGPTKYEDKHGNKPEEPPGGWVRATAKSELFEYLVDLIEKNIVTSVSESNCSVFRFLCDSRFNY